LDEVRAVLNRPELAERFPSLTADRTDAVLREARRHADWFEAVPKRYSLPSHPKDDHLFNLAIQANARYLVPWENRLLNVPHGLTDLARQLRELAPGLEIITPVTLASLLQTDQPKNG
jgi:predicted nucleic acid-binding protein